MIKKSIFTCFVVFIVYTLLMTLYPKVAVTTHQWQGNTIKAQNYLYNNSDTLENVIIGTSLACCILMDSLQDYYNLAFSGLSIHEGLDVLLQREKLPQNIFIETNYTLKKENSDFNEGLSHPLLFNLKKYIISLREGRQPLAIAGVAVQKLTKKVYAQENIDTSESYVQRKNILHKMLKIKTKEYNKEPASESINEKYSFLNKKISELKAKGVNVIFFEMPVHCSLTDLPMARKVREHHKLRFPENLYPYIKMPDCKEYITGDGVHITFAEAQKYTSYFKKECLKFKAKY